MTRNISYAQYGEDILLATFFDKTDEGFYVDIGANYETEDSVTKHFYNKGWRGVNVEPVPKLYNILAKKRPRDVNLNIGVGRSNGRMTFREYDIHGHSTFSAETMQHEDKSIGFKEYKVKTMPLERVIAKYATQPIDFLKIDVEGFEYEVVKSNDWQKNRPKVICIEADHVDKDWRPILKDNKYNLFIADGLNEYYIAEEVYDELTKDFSERAVNVKASFVRKDIADEIKHLKHVLKNQEKVNSENASKLEDLRLQNHQLSENIEIYRATSYRNQSLRRRLKIAAKSLVDWTEYKRNDRK